jgi:hypothetical protein
MNTVPESSFLNLVARIRGLFMAFWPDFMHIADVPAHIASNAKAAMTASLWADVC